MKKAVYKAGIIGAGSIADWHVRALKTAGFTVVSAATRPNSVRVREFARKHQIQNVFSDWKELLQHSENLDALVITAAIDVTPQIFQKALALKIPTLVEKPVAWNSAAILKILKKAHPRVMVGYNRRFYATVQAAKKQLNSGSPLLAHFTLPERVDLNTLSSDNGYLKPFFSNSCHALDMARFIFGELRVDSVKRLINGKKIAGFAATLSNRRGDIIQMTANWGSPSNFSLSLDRTGTKFELRPFELASIYEGMDVIEPSDEYPVRRYQPKLRNQISLDPIDFKEKPGFTAQAEALRMLVDGKKSPVAATLLDALAAVRLCESLVGQRLK